MKVVMFILFVIYMAGNLWLLSMDIKEQLEKEAAESETQKKWPTLSEQVFPKEERTEKA